MSPSTRASDPGSPHGQIMSIDASGFQISLDHKLAGDAAWSRPRHPQARVAEHPVPADHDVFQRHKQGVPVVQAARHIGRGHGYDEGRTLPKVWVRLGPKQAMLYPEVVPASLSLSRLVRRVRFWWGAASGGGRS